MLVLRVMGFIVMSIVICTLLWFFYVIPVYALEGGERCTSDGHCSVLGDFYFRGGDWLVVVVFALVGAT